MLAAVPGLWLIGIGGYNSLLLVYDLSIYELALTFFECQRGDMILYSGLSLIIAARIYLRLPFPLFLMYVPLFGRFDTFIANACCLVGILLVLVRILI